MNNLARKLHRDGDIQEAVGVILRSDGEGRFAVHTDDGEVHARRAVSCLVAPELHDEVLIKMAGDGRAWVVAVLEREEGARTRVVFEGDMDIELPKGRLGMSAAKGIDLTAGKAVSINAGELNVSAFAGSVVLQKLSYVGTLLSAEVQAIKTVAATVDSVLERFSQRVKRSYRKVEEIDRVQAKEIHYAAENNAFLSGENALVTAEELVKLDGEQVHLG
jgi:hypothetical protein